MPPQYKFVEVSPVTEETLEAAVNEWVGKGWQLEGIRFVTTEHSKRPQMAFVSFVMAPAQSAQAASQIEPPVTSVTEAAPPDPAARVIVASHGDDVE